MKIAKPDAAVAVEPRPSKGPLPSGHLLDETESRCLKCGWQFRAVQVSTGNGSSLPNYQFRIDDRDTWRPLYQDPTEPPRWPRCPRFTE